MAKKAMASRIRAVEEALEGTPKTLQSGSSTESIRTSTGPGLAMLPFLTINDIIALRQAGFKGLQDIEEHVLEVPDEAWDHVLDLVRAGIARIGPQALVPPPPKPKKAPKAESSAGSSTNGKAAEAKEPEPEPEQCAALTQAGTQCKNPSRPGSKYCVTHKGYRPPPKKKAKQSSTSNGGKKAKGKGKSKKGKKAKSSAKKNGGKKAKKKTKKASNTAKKTASKKGSSSSGKQARCAAETNDGRRCKNPSRQGSKYCSSHKGYRPKRT